MSGSEIKQNTSQSSNTATIHTRQSILHNFLLIWLDANIDQTNKEYQNTLIQLRNVINNVNIFTEPNQCVDYLTENEGANTFLIVSDTFGRQIIPLIHDIPHLDAIYIFCNSKSKYEQWSNAWVKIKGLHTDITPICENLQQTIKHCNQDSIAISFLRVDEETANQNLNQLEPTFMYTQIFKEILFEMEYNQQSVKDFATYCRNGDYGAANNITKFENEYNTQLAILWYTHPSFIFSLLNNALRTLEADTIIHMGFFIRDLHHQIQELYKKQIGIYDKKPFIVYRGQGLLITDFGKLGNTKGGLMSFNNFLSTSKQREISLGFAMAALTKSDMVGILFEMTIDPSVSSATFALIDEVSYFKTEEEILFSMHTVFRIGKINKLDQDSPLYQVELKLTADDDQQLRILTEHIRDENMGNTGWERLNRLLFELNQLDKAEELSKTLLQQTSDESKKAIYYNNLGCIKRTQGHHDQAIWYYEKSLEIQQKTPTPNLPDLATSYNNIAELCDNMGEYAKALSFYEKSLEILQKTFVPNHPSLATSYNNIAGMCNHMGDYSKALSFYEKSLEIRQKTLPSNHPDLATSYNNIGLVYYNMGDYSKALSFSKKSLEIQQKTLPSNHPDLVASYNNIGLVYYNMREYSKALSFYEKSLEIQQNTLPPNHPDLATSYNNIGWVSGNMGEYSKALSFYGKSLEIRQNTLPPNHSSLATSYNNIAGMYNHMGDYSKALSFYEKSLEIQQKTLPSNHPDLATSYNNIGLVYYNMGDYSKALSFYEKSLEIRQKTLPSNHPDLATSFNNICLVYNNMEQYLKALSFSEKSLEIQQKTLPPNHPDLVASYNNIGVVYYNMEQYSKALSFFEKSLEFQQKTLPPNHPHLQSIREHIQIVKRKL